MRRIWEAFLPYDPNRRWYTTLSQVAIMGYLAAFGTLFAVIFSPLFVGVLAYYIGASAVRGFRNRWHFFTTGNFRTDPEACWWDSTISLGLWMSLGALFGRTFFDWYTAGALGIAGIILGALMEVVYHAADAMVLMPSSDTVPRNTKWQNSYVGNGGDHELNVNRNSSNDANYYYRKTPWQWAGYQADRGPKEDALFPMGD